MKESTAWVFIIIFCIIIVWRLVMIIIESYNINKKKNKVNGKAKLPQQQGSL
jgi:membrane protein CcdC involved in cytochrome C biogenesis